MQHTRPHVIPRSTSQYTRQAKNVPTAQTQVSRASRIKVHFGGICVPESEKERQWTETLKITCLVVTGQRVQRLTPNHVTHLILFFYENDHTDLQKIGARKSR